MSEENTYRTVEKRQKASFREKGSRFLSYLIPVQSEADVKWEMESLKKEYYDATHHCYAYILGFDKEKWRANDDGEPSGTAGRPIYGQLLSSDLTNVLLVVIRYFGGTKLGTGGLITAYKTAAQQVILEAEIRTKEKMEEYRVEYPYEAMNEVMKILKSDAISILSTDFGTKCAITFAIKKSNTASFLASINKINGLEIKELKMI